MNYCSKTVHVEFKQVKLSASGVALFISLSCSGTKALLFSGPMDAEASRLLALGTQGWAPFDLCYLEALWQPQRAEEN